MVFARQFRALVRKNLLVAVVRQPFGFLFSIYGIPIAILAILLSIPTFLQSSIKMGITNPNPLRSLADTIHKKVVIVRPPELGPDVDRVIEKFTETIDKSLLYFIDYESGLETLCMANLRGISNCHASVTFIDSPETTAIVKYPNQDYTITAGNHTWNYVIRIDPASRDGTTDATGHENKEEIISMPLVLAVNNAITNTTVVPETFSFTRLSQKDQDREDQLYIVKIIAQVFVFAFFICHFTIVYRHTTLITSERESGMSQLIDAMGGGNTVIMRTLSWLFVFDLYCLPIYIIFGVLYWNLLFPSSGLGLIIGWQILQGLAVNSSTVFAAAFFTKSRVSAIYVIGSFLLVAVGAQIYGFQEKPLPQPFGVHALSLLFPSSNHVFFTEQMALWEVAGLSADISKLPVPVGDVNSYSYKLKQATMLGFLVICIFVYPVLAIIVEKFMHGINFRNRSLDNTTSESTNVVAETADLKKRFVPNFLESIFCWGKRRPVTAVDGVSLQGHKGQILCLVGPNGSGKTTTLHMMSGFIKPSAGSVKLGVPASQVGICPQRNIFWKELTVKEHVAIWGQIKASKETSEELDDLIETCDLGLKRNCKCKTLSGGQQRKLQLACMFVGGSSVCLIDECTSGLDPLSRRVIWEILLQQRSKRSIILTTHFLDEVEVLADHIVILTNGKVKCQGSSAELKNLYGGGYRVLVPLDATIPRHVAHDFIEHQDRRIFSTPDSQTAAQLSSELTAYGVTDIMIAGPQVEDVFLRVADDSDVELRSIKSTTNLTDPNFEMTPGGILAFWSQVKVLFRKRFTVLRRFWWPYLYVVVLPIVSTPLLQGFMTEYEAPSCENLKTTMYSSVPAGLWYNEYCITNPGICEEIVLGPASANDTMFGLWEKQYWNMDTIELYGDFVNVVDSRDQLWKLVSDNRKLFLGGIHMGSSSEPPLIAYSIGEYGGDWGTSLVNQWSQMQSGLEIVSSVGKFAEIRMGAENNGVIYVVFFTLLQALYPAAFVLYPAIEKARKVRALEYANGVRRGPLWIAYGLFDGMFVMVISIVISVIISQQLPWNGTIWIMLPIMALYGFAAILLGYVIAHFTNGPLKSFLVMAGISILMYGIAAISFALGSSYSDVGDIEIITNGLTFGLNIILPIGNVFRSAMLGLNVLNVGCKNGAHSPLMSIYAYGSPILYLVIQVVVLLLLIIWLEGDMALFRRNGVPVARADNEKSVAVRSIEVEAEKVRVANSEDDLMRILGLDKSFGSNHAVNNVSLGLTKGEVMALLGPNGAGKSTMVNMIQSELSPDHGKILLCGEDSRARSAQKYLGICPQYDALDLMSCRKQLVFYARVKGIKDVKGNVDHVMDRLGLTPHANTLASKLSGGNKRKLSLAIALMGTPPVLVLDEPTSAMDAVAKRSFWRLIKDIAPGRSVLLTTHSMEEADTLATRAAIISKHLLAVGTTQALRERYSNVYYVNLLLKSAPKSTTEEMLRVRGWIFDRIPGAQLEREMLGGQMRFTIPGVGSNGRSPVPQVIELLEREKDNVGIEYYSIGGATLESVFLSVVRKNNVQEEDGVGHRGILSRLLRR